ncbi:MAG: bifunctional oligoribonuclease/PAP phosphatase NrnA [Candidatus Eisenbacteria bacterium]
MSAPKLDSLWQPFEDLVQSKQSFVLSTHVNPDGDGLGSEVALGLYLLARGKDVVVFNDGRAPHNFAFLERLLPLEAFTPERAEAVFASAEVLVVLDMQNRERLGRVAPYVDRPGLLTVILDHHVGNAAFGQLNIVVPEKAATGELIYDYLKCDPERLSRPMADALYAALVTDTGSFRHSNTDPDVHRMAAHLLTLGVQSAVVQAEINRQRHMDRLRFVGQLLQDLKTSDDGSVAWFEVTPELFARYHVDGSDTEGLVDFPRTVPGVAAVMMLTDLGDDRVKVSLRSSGRVDVNRVAQSLGGGGHKFAAGITLAGSLAQARQTMLAGLAEAVGALDPAALPYAGVTPPAGR